MVKNSPAGARDTGDMGLIPESGRSPGEGSDNPLHCSGKCCGQRSLQTRVHRITGPGMAGGLAHSQTLGLCDSERGQHQHHLGACQRCRIREQPAQDPRVMVYSSTTHGDLCPW